MKYTVYWFESDSFNGKQYRAWRDFEEYENAVDFKRQKHPLGHVAAISDSLWHPSHAYPSYLSVIQDRMINRKKK